MKLPNKQELSSLGTILPFAIVILIGLFFIVWAGNNGFVFLIVLGLIALFLMLYKNVPDVVKEPRLYASELRRGKESYLDTDSSKASHRAADRPNHRVIDTLKGIEW